MNEPDLIVNDIPKEINPTPNDIARFRGRVIIKNKEECWEYSMSLDRDGYGQFWMQKHMHKAHRIAWIIDHGKIPDGLCVLHSCDNPPCCNPWHLFLGTKKDNAKDMASKGRNSPNAVGLPGILCRRHKLSEEQVLQIRSKYLAGTSGRVIANLFLITPENVSHIVNRKTWRHLL